MANCVILINGKKVDITTLIEQLGESLDNQPSPNYVSELFEQNTELANAIYEASGFNNTNVEEFKGIWKRSDVAKQENKVFLFGDNTNDRTVTKYVPSTTQAVIRGLSNAIGIDTKKDRGTNEGIKVQSENISSKGSEFAKKLTNVGNNVGLIYKGKQYVNSEHAYQTWKSGEFNQEGYNLKGGKVRGGKIGDTFNIMIDILTEKLKQHPDLIKGINERGGLDYISKSTHNVIGDNFWESTGQNKFIEALYQAAINVGIKNNTSSYFTDSDFEWFKNHVDEQIQQAKNSGKTIVIPADGIGTGKAMLKEKAPKLFEYLQQELNKLKQQITLQEAQQLYSQYLESLDKSNTNPILKDNQQEQVKKFAELQERLNNKEFIEGAKNTYEGNKGLQEWGTQEQYNDYIARVSLGIIKNPSNGEYNYTSQVKDIVYHGTDKEFYDFKLGNDEVIHFGTELSAAQRIDIDGTSPRTMVNKENFIDNGRIIPVFLNIKDLKKGIDYLEVSNSFKKPETEALLDIAGYDEKLQVYAAAYDYGILSYDVALTAIKNNEPLKNVFGGDGYSYVNKLEDKGKTSYVVYEPSQIHILGSKQDIKGFKEFVNDDKLDDSLNDFNSIIGYAESVLNNSSTNELIQKRLEINKFEDISVDKLMPLDTVLVDGVVKNIDTVEDYYNLKHSKDITKVTRVNNAARNLKPLTISWKENGVSKNLFDLDSVLLKHYIIDRNVKDLTKLTELTDSTDKRVILLNAFIKKFNIGDVQTLSTYLSAWTERATQLLDSGLSLKSLLDTDLKNVAADLKILFSDDSLIQDSLIDPEISKIYSIEDGNVSKISDYSREPMEIILPNNFKQFQIDGHSLSEIKEKGSKFFEDIFKKAEKREDSLTISTRDSNSNIFVYSANERNFNKQPHNINLIEEYKEGEKILSYYEGTERVFYIKASEKSLYRIHKVGGVINVILLADDDISKIEVEIEAIIPEFFDDLDLLYEKLNSDTITDDDRDTVLSLLKQRNTLLEEKNQKTENDSSYINFIKTFKNINYIIPPKKKNKLLSGIANRYYNLPGNGEFDINKIAKIQYNSWEKSLEYLAARIPAQSLQSVTSAKAVGFHSEGNIAYISTWMLYIQGADLDIDKAYLMGYSINNGATMSGDFKGIDLSEKKNFDIAISLPNIREKEIIFSNSPITTTEDKLFQDIWNNYDFINNANHDYSTFKRAVIKLTHLINASDSNEFKLNVGDIKLEGSFNKEYIDLINSINKNRLSKESTKTLDNLISIEDEIKFLKHIYPWFRVKSQNENIVVGSIHNMIERASNQVALTSPVDNDELAQLEKIKSPGIIGLNPQDGFSIYEQKAKGAMGMSGVGISANQNKTHLAVTNKLNKWMSTGEYLNTNVLTSKTFHKKLLVPKLISGNFSDLSNAVVEFTEQDFYTLSDLGFTRAYKQFLKNLYKVEDITLKKSNSMLGISTFISASVDNAKKLFLEKVNASPELLGMHLYLTSIGYTLTESALFMTHSGVLDLIVRDFSMINGDSTEYIEELIEKKIKGGTDTAYWESFKSIYQGAQEFRNLAAIYKINQKMTADIEEIYAYKNKFKIALFQREHFFWTAEEINQLKTLSNKSKHLDSLAQKILNNIFPNHPKNSSNLIKDIKNILLRNSDIIGGKFNIDLYFKDEKYQKRVVEYYNLIKHTENIFDTILSVPHFKARIDAFIRTIYNMEQISAKSKFIETVKREYKEDDLKTIRTGVPSEFGESEKKIPHYFGNKELPLNIAKENSSKLSYYFDVLAKLHWAQTSKKGISKIKINVGEVIESIKSNLSIGNQENDPADTIDALEFFTISDYQKLELVKYDSKEANDIEINLTSDIGVANFKIFMENLILPYIKIVGKDNDKLEKFLNNTLLVKSYSPLGLFTYQIGTYAGVNNAKSEYNRDLADQFIASFNILDSELSNASIGDKKLDLRIKNKNEEYLDFRDLFYLYNIFVTNERFGEKTLTATFKEYVGTNLAMDWNNFYNTIEEQELDLETLVVDKYLENTLNISDSKTREALRDNLRIFYGFQSKGSVRYKSGGDLSKELKLPNKDFPFTLSLEMAESNTSKKSKNYAKVFKILEKVKSNILTININCE